MKDHVRSDSDVAFYVPEHPAWAAVTFYYDGTCYVHAPHYRIIGWDVENGCLIFVIGTEPAKAINVRAADHYQEAYTNYLVDGILLT